jgi:acyl-CoA synthetase (NDP forming)
MTELGRSGAATLGRLFAPRGVAFVGVSEDRGKYNGRVIQYCIEAGFAGAIYPVNPRYRAVFDRPCFPDVTAIPGLVDVVVAMVGPERLAGLYAGCQERGVGHIIVIGDLGPRDGPEREARLAALCEQRRSGGPRIVGPQCVGVVAPHRRLAMSIASGLAGGLPAPGRVGVISQSGGILSALIDRSRASGVGFSYLVSSGGEFDLTVCDYLEFMIEDDLSTSIAICAEGLADYDRFFALAGRARAAGKPILLLKPGRSRAGAEAALSHSGQIAGDRDIQASAFRRHGVVLVEDIDDLHVSAALLGRFRVDPGKGVGAVSLSGGYAVVVGDALSAAGLPVADLAPATVERIKAEAAQPRPANPVDAAGRPQPGREALDVRVCLDALDADPNVGATLYAEMLFLNMETIIPELTAFVARARKPHFTCWQAGPAVASILAALRAGGVFATDSLTQATRALAALYTYAELAMAPPPPCLVAAPSPRLHARPPGPLDEATARQLLADYQVPFVPEVTVPRGADVAAAARPIGYPVALKGVVPNCTHKTERGLVRLDLRDDDALRSAAAAMAGATPDLAGFQVQRMVPGGLEFIVGVKSDIHVGPAMVLNAGGIFVETMGAPAIELAPLDPDRARAMIDRVDAKGILRGYRTGRAYDRAGLADLLGKVGRLAHDNRERLAELDLNPVIVTEAGVVAVDAVVVLQ